MPSYTPERTWANGDVVGQSDLNTYLRDNVDYLKGVADGLTFSGVEVTRDAATSIATATDTDITWAAETFDYGGWFSSGTEMIVPAGAIPSGFTSIAVLLLARTKFADNGTGYRKLQILKNGTPVSGPTVSAFAGEVTEIDTQRFTTAVAGDAFKVSVHQTSGGNLNVTGTLLSVVRFLPAA